MILSTVSASSGVTLSRSTMVPASMFFSAMG
jgi:hypothetical protein